MQRVNIVLVDDIDGTEIASETEGATISFALDGSTYEIDLTNEHATALRDVLAPYVTAARNVTRKPRAVKGATGAKRGRPPKP